MTNSIYSKYLAHSPLPGTFISQHEFTPLPWSAEELIGSEWINVTTGQRHIIAAWIPNFAGIHPGILESKPPAAYPHLTGAANYLGRWIPSTPPRYVFDQLIRIDNLPPNEHYLWRLREIEWYTSEIARHNHAYTTHLASTIHTGTPMSREIARPYTQTLTNLHNALTALQEELLDYALTNAINLQVPTLH